MDEEGQKYCCLVAEGPDNMQTVPGGRISWHSCTCRHTDIEVVDDTCHLTQSRHTTIRPALPAPPPPLPSSPHHTGRLAGDHNSTSLKSFIVQHFSDEINPAEVPSMYQVLWSASVCQLRYLPCIKYCGLPVSVS